MSEATKEITQEDLRKVIDEVTVEFLRLHREEIIKRAHARLREQAREERTEEKEG